MKVTKQNATLVKTLIEAVLDTRYTFRTAGAIADLTGEVPSELKVLAEGLGLDTSKKRRRDGATLISIGDASRDELKALREIIVALYDVRYELRTLGSIANKADLPFSIVEDVAQAYDFPLKSRNSDGALLVGFAE